MKYSAFFISILIFLTPLNTYAQDCYDAYSSADDAYTYARRGYNSDNLDDLQYYARKAKNSAEEAMSAAEDCYCDDAYSSADDAYTYAKRAYRETDFDSAQYQIRRAKNAADEAMSNADDCGT